MTLSKVQNPARGVTCYFSQKFSITYAPTWVRKFSQKCPAPHGSIFLLTTADRGNIIAHPPSCILCLEYLFYDENHTYSQCTVDTLCLEDSRALSLLGGLYLQEIVATAVQPAAKQIHCDAVNLFRCRLNRAGTVLCYKAMSQSHQNVPPTFGAKT